MKGGEVYAEILKNLKNNLKRINLMKGETQVEHNKEEKQKTHSQNGYIGNHRRSWLIPETVGQ